jgi:PTH1 family peptidyl-tRNA hydrolase
MIAFIGLGNPGDKYANTKHNAGYWVLDEIANRQKLGFKPVKGDYVFAQHQRRELLLVKPTTGMNLSGVAVKDVANRWNLLPTEIYIVLDDVDLPLGSIRIRPKGGDGCHRGMENIIYQLRFNNFPRLRLGVATDENLRPAEKFVLKPFRKDDEFEAEAMVKRGADALENLLVHGLNHTMNHFNS